MQPIATIPRSRNRERPARWATPASAASLVPVIEMMRKPSKPPAHVFDEVVAVVLALQHHLHHGLEIVAAEPFRGNQASSREVSGEGLAPPIGAGTAQSGPTNSAGFGDRPDGLLRSPGMVPRGLPRGIARRI